MLGDGTGGFLCTNNGIRALLRVLREIFDHIEYEKGEKLYKSNAEDLCREIDKYTKPLLEYFSNLDSDEISYYRNRTALKGVNQNTMWMLSEIHKVYSEFHPKKLEKYLEKLDQEGTEEAKSKIDDISRHMFVFVIGKLFDKHDDSWWYDGVPGKVREGCIIRRDKEKGAKDKEQYLRLIDYHSIASKDWNLFKDFFAIGQDGGKKGQLDWLVKLNDIRNITHHPEKWPPEKKQVELVRQIHKHVIDKMT